MERLPKESSDDSSEGKRVKWEARDTSPEALHKESMEQFQRGADKVNKRNQEDHEEARSLLQKMLGLNKPTGQQYTAVDMAQTEANEVNKIVDARNKDHGHKKEYLEKQGEWRSNSRVAQDRMGDAELRAKNVDHPPLGNTP